MKLRNYRGCALSFLSVLFMLSNLHVLAVNVNPKPVKDLLERIGGEGAAGRFVTVVDEDLAENGNDVFVLTSQKDKPCIKGSSVLAVTTGINWYLNHVAHVNLAWNQLTADLVHAELPLPLLEEKRVCSADYRYYLNYCTFSYSMSTWTWERWQQEIDWMALHGINMPLQIVGLDVVWYRLLTQDLGYTAEEANRFVAGPCFQAWWGMNNLQGWGGPNPAWWYERQAQLARKICKRERELGMEPVLPGYAGMVPADIEKKKGYKANSQGHWCAGFERPYILDPNSEAFAEVSHLYYAQLEKLMGRSVYYSMDPFHEGANTEGIDVSAAYRRICQAMVEANREAKWVIQYWQWSKQQYHVVDQVEKGRLIVLDLFSDGFSRFETYKGHDAVYCMLANYGGRTGLFGRLTKVMKDYYVQKAKHGNVKGIGATPEAIEQTPVLYDALFELPWREKAPDAAAWLAGYTRQRYGVVSPLAQAAWERLRQSALNCPTALQGPHEAVVCARPSLKVKSVSSWGGTDLFYDPQLVTSAAHDLLAANLQGDNYRYDLVDVARQALTDYAYCLLKGIAEADTAKDRTAYEARRNIYLSLMLDLDELLNTNPNFMLGYWTNMARRIADEAKGTTEADRRWLELDNARTLVTTWGDEKASEWGGLRDYSYREWGGLVRDFYYPRWKTFFDCRDQGRELPESWFEHDWRWAHNALLHYTEKPQGETAEVAKKLFGKYFIPVSLSAGRSYYVFRLLHNTASPQPLFAVHAREAFTLPIGPLPQGVSARLSVDFNGDKKFSNDETFDGKTAVLPASIGRGHHDARLTLTDGTVFDFVVSVN